MKERNNIIKTNNKFLDITNKQTVISTIVQKFTFL